MWYGTNVYVLLIASAAFLSQCQVLQALCSATHEHVNMHTSKHDMQGVAHVIAVVSS
jgi:hypothetical protein